MTRIAQALTKLFEKHRIVFWYDSKQELRADFEALTLEEIEKIELNNNEFGVKYRILRQQPQQKFLLYHEGSPPDDLNNWLLDVQLAHGEFRTDQIALWLAEIDLGLEFSEVVENYTPFFQAQERKESLKRLLKPDDTLTIIKLKMLAVCTKSDPRLDAIVETLLAELADNREDKINLVSRCHLHNFFWEQIERLYGYQSQDPRIKDFALELFKSCYAMGTEWGTEGQFSLMNEALIFLKRWKDSIRCKNSFETLSHQCAEDLDIEGNLIKRDFREVIDIDYFYVIDQKIIRELVHTIVQRTVSSAEVSQWVRQRKQTHWYPEFQNLYEAIDAAAQFIHTLDEADLTIDSLANGIERYSNFWYRLDQLYRKFIYHVRCSAQSSLLESLSEMVENLYVNNYLLTLNDQWQSFVDSTTNWFAPPIYNQNRFFERWVEPFLKKDRKIYVIISDALRYEIGDELISLIRKEDRYEATLEPALAMLPSYTQLGMAALLPNTTLTLAENQSGTVKVDGQSSQGIENRKKQLERLESSISKRGTAIKAEELLNFNKDKCRALLRDHDVVYIYHNRIDASGDKRESEEQVFEAVKETLEELGKLIKKLTGANASNIIVTADHGFIYQNRILAESDFTSVDPQGEQILLQNRRFILGKNLQDNSSLHKFTSQQLGLVGDVEVQIPKSINRLRLKGSGSRYVHGGASLQEVVIPVVKINKKRQSDTTSVEVDILRGASSIITSSQLTVILYQSQPVTDKVQPRHLKAGIYNQSEELISDSQEVTFDIGSENPRDREIPVTFLLTRKADEANGQEVKLCLEEKVSGTSHYKKYKSILYTMRRSFTSDFDF